MALMSNLRDKTHIVLYTLLAAFLALIVFEWGMNFSGFGSGGGREAARINGESVPYERYEELYRQISDSARRSSPGGELTPEAEHAVQEQAWNTLVDRTLLEQQFRAFQITLQDQEVLEAIERPIPPQVIASNFTNAETGQIDRARLDSARMDPQNAELWKQVEQIIRQELKIEKLVHALRTLPQLTARELEDVVRREYTSFSASFIPLDLSAAGPDSSFSIADKEIETYYKEQRELFRQEPVRSAEYVYFPLLPSRKDSLNVRDELETLRTDFAASADVAEMVRVQSDTPDAVSRELDRSDFSPEAGEKLFSSPQLKAGGMIGPIADRGQYRLIKVEKVTRAESRLARASHILLPVNPQDPLSLQQAQRIASGILKQLGEGASFAELAQSYSLDPGSASRGGDLGWFTRERMVPEFSDAVFGAKAGAIVGPVQSQFGLHIIKVAGFDRQAIVASEITRNIRPSTETIQSVRRMATVFQMDADEKGFDESANAAGHAIRATGEFSRNAAIEGIGYSDPVATFAFKAREGQLSDVIETERGFYVLRLTGRNDSGYRALDDELRTLIATELRREKKGEALKQRLADLAAQPGATLEKIAATDPALRMVKADNIRWRDGFIPGYGTDRVLVEALSGMEPEKLSRPVQTMNGYALAVLSGTSLPEGLDVKTEAAGIAPQFRQLKEERLFQEYFESIRKNAKIEDLRP